MRFHPPLNRNYAAQIVRIPAVVDLPGLDKLVGVPVLGHQALTTRGPAVGDLMVAFTAETQLSEGFARENDLYRDSSLNKTEATGYLKRNRRVRALKLRGNVSNALLMPLSSLEYALGADWVNLQEGDTFDALNGSPVCNKYEIPTKLPSQPAGKIVKAFKRVTDKQFPMHLDTDNYWRSKHLLQPGREVIVTQKVHGTSVRVGRVPVLRKQKWREKLLKRFGVPIPESEYAAVFGSRKVIKDPGNPNQNHYYDTDGDDLWTYHGKKVAHVIPEGAIVYGEILGFTPHGQPIQKDYTYHLPMGDAELRVYRVATVNAQGFLSDLAWDGVKEFCRARGLKWVPELDRVRADAVETFLESFLNERLADFGDWVDLPLIVSDHRTVDEGVCLRQEGLVPVILKAKSDQFLAHETALLDKGEANTEAAA
jgi:hypothetical protein